jgi:hypothetical protein
LGAVTLGSAALGLVDTVACVMALAIRSSARRERSTKRRYATHSHQAIPPAAASTRNAYVCFMGKV